jgi:predicted ABC-type ATPase
MAKVEESRLSRQFSDWRWRLNNLYFIVDKEGNRVQFKLNWAQENLFDQMHYMNVVLKARQLGFTTFIQLFMLDACIFNANIRAGTIAHRLDDAKTIFRDKIKYPYDNLPDGLKNRVRKESDSADELLLSNNSSIRVGTSLRSGTLRPGLFLYSGRSAV